MAWLFVLLLASIGVEPLLDAVGANLRALEWALAGSLLAAVAGSLAVRGSRLVAAGVGLALAAWLVIHLAHFGSSSSLGLVALAAACFLAAGAIVPAVFRGGHVDSERIAGALSAYLLLGVGFGAAFGTIESLAPGSLRGQAAGPRFELADAVYFSIVTIATLGYGDIVPATRAARGLAVLEAVIGQLYLTVLVARLVSLYAEDTHPRGGGPLPRGGGGVEPGP